jgi:hypothetical protein
MAQSRSFMYRNHPYRFILRLPRWMRAYTTVRIRRQPQEPKYQVHFKFKYRHKIYDDIFAILVFNKSQTEWQKEYDDSPLAYICSRGNRTFAGLTPEELPYAFVDPKTGNYDYRRYGRPIKLLKRMVNQEVPKILSTFRLQGSPIARQRRRNLSQSGCSCSHSHRMRISSIGSRVRPAPWLAPRVRSSKRCSCRA